MGKYLKSYKAYPAGTLVISKTYGFWKRLWYWLKKKRREYNTLYILPTSTGVGLSKVELLLNDYYLFVPLKPYTRTEIKKLNTILKSCSTEKDYLTAINAIRPNTVDVDGSIEQFRTNKYYKKIYLDTEPFQEINKHDTKQKD